MNNDLQIIRIRYDVLIKMYINKMYINGKEQLLLIDGKKKTETKES